MTLFVYNKHGYVLVVLDKNLHLFIPFFIIGGIMRNILCPAEQQNTMINILGLQLLDQAGPLLLSLSLSSDTN